MQKQLEHIRRMAATFIACGLITSWLFGAAGSLLAQTVDPESVLGDTTMPSSDDVSQTFPYGITGKTPPSLTKINFQGQPPYHKHRINLRLFQGCPQVEISEGGRLWATWFGSNVQAERAPYHKDQFSVISTSADDGKTWKEVFVFDPSELLGGGASDPMLWKDPQGNIRFIGLRNIDFKGKDEFATSAWEFTMVDPENEHTAWTEPRLLGNKNISVMKPLVFPDGTIMRSMDDFKLVGQPDKVRIRFLKEDVDGKPIFVSEFPVDNDAVFAEQMPILRRDGSLFTFYRARKGQKFAESFDGGKSWKLGGYYPMQFSINTKCILKTLPSGRVLLVANDVQMKEESGKKEYYFTDEHGNERELTKHKTTRTRMTAFLSEDDGKTFPHRMLLCDDGQISYPSATLGKDGSIYIVYDQGRGVIGQHTIFLSKITEQDILSGKPVNKDSFLNNIVSRPGDQGGGRREGDSI
ncbi:exo-alpha-sialidase [Roseiconus nitratireducens]|uniref:Exo-alpha-sialidase n=1 Tax=Roseiconus nitratireducens TaxID=2605748 RepID=A0A5M6D8D9_9BACT|nr:sialidase family protein [Roseiconus nitratireducens]KAA5542149.1 exo-alpha-sialidase [Roseiconus nitratireducens]